MLAQPTMPAAQVDDPERLETGLASTLWLIVLTSHLSSDHRRETELQDLVWNASCVVKPDKAQFCLQAVVVIRFRAAPRQSRYAPRQPFGRKPSAA
ncbi:hypothetical protein [Cereibacter sphaeroides]|uniref:hypothetical protein n=1 Tax=Cereibacter sphaeroides TaxID=1063 RepID=UPI001131124D|nr:hypothetical protein [Cereibacter sphaeroides]